MRTSQLTFILAILFCFHVNMPLRAGNSENFHPGYIIVGSDTTKGFIHISDHFTNAKQCTFKETPEGIERKYAPEDLIAYGVDGKSYFYAAVIPSESLSGNKVFLSCLIKSDISLYSYRNRFFVQSESGIKELKEVKSEVVRDGETFSENKALYKSVLQQQMNECATMYEKLKGAKLTENSLVSLFKDYATCAGHAATEFSSRTLQNRRIRFGFTVGLLAADLTFKSPSNSVYIFSGRASGDRSITFTPSVFVEFGVSRKFDVRTGISWYSTKHHFHAESTLANLTHDFYFKTSRIEVPVLLKYSLLSGPVKWSLIGGSALNGIIQYEDRLVISRTTSGYEVIEYNNDLEKNGLFLNWMGGVSTEFLLGSRSFIVEGYYNRSASITDSGTDIWLDGFKISMGMFL